MNRYILTFLISILLWSSLGCVENEASTRYNIDDLDETSYIYNSNKSSVCETSMICYVGIMSNEKWGVVWFNEDIYIKKYTGIIIEVGFSSIRNQDTILFSDGLLINVNGAEMYTWKVGKIHVIDVQQERSWNNEMFDVLSVEIIN